MAEPTEPKKTLAQEASETGKTVVWALLIAFVLRVILFEPFTIPSSSMEPGLRTGDYIVATKFDYGWSKYSVPFNPPLPPGRWLGGGPARGDVAIFKLPSDPKVNYVKRIIGLPGDRVRVTGGVVEVNGTPIARTAAGVVEDPEMPGMRVTRYFEARADGKPYLTFDQGDGHPGDDTETFVVPEGHYFAMGDNRDNSLDSRWRPIERGVGFVPADNLVGKVRFILLSWNEGASILKPWTWPNVRLDRFFLAVN